MLCAQIDGVPGSTFCGQVRRVADADEDMQNATSKTAVPLSEHAMKLRGISELDGLVLAFEVHTRLDGQTGGRAIMLRTDSLEDCQR